MWSIPLPRRGCIREANARAERGSGWVVPVRTRPGISTASKIIPGRQPGGSSKPRMRRLQSSNCNPLSIRDLLRISQLTPLIISLFLNRNPLDHPGRWRTGEPSINPESRTPRPSSGVASCPCCESEIFGCAHHLGVPMVASGRAVVCCFSAASAPLFPAPAT